MVTVPVLRMRWVDLCFLHWAVAPAAVAAVLPPGLRVDTHGGQAWIGIVPFRMQAVRPLGLPRLPGLSDFLELNCRTYVRDRHDRPGVWFFSLDCDQPLAVVAAHTGFGLRYRHAHLAASRPGPDRPVAYASQRPEGRCRFCYRRSGPWTEARDDPLTAFLVERYRLFARRGRQLVTGCVAHPPYRVARATVSVDCGALFTGNDLTDPDRPPDHTTVAEDLQVTAGAPVAVTRR